MARIEGSVLIRAPRARAFEVLADGDNAHLWSSSVVRAHHETAPPIRVGSRLAVEARAGRKEYRWVQEVVGWEPPRGFDDTMVPGSGPFARFRDWGRFEEEAGGTRFTFGLEYRLPYGPFGALLDALVVGPRVRRDFATSLARAQALVEGGRPPAQEPGRSSP